MWMLKLQGHLGIAGIAMKIQRFFVSLLWTSWRWTSPCCWNRCWPADMGWHAQNYIAAWLHRSVEPLEACHFLKDGLTMKRQIVATRKRENFALEVQQTSWIIFQIFSPGMNKQFDSRMFLGLMNCPATIKGSQSTWCHVAWWQMRLEDGVRVRRFEGVVGLGPVCSWLKAAMLPVDGGLVYLMVWHAANWPHTQQLSMNSHGWSHHLPTINRYDWLMDDPKWNVSCYFTGVISSFSVGPSDCKTTGRQLQVNHQTAEIDNLYVMIIYSYKVVPPS